MRFWRVLALGATRSDDRGTGSVLPCGNRDLSDAASVGSAAGEVPCQ